MDETVLIIGREIEKELSDNPKSDPFRNEGRNIGEFARMKTPGIAKVKIPENGIW